MRTPARIRTAAALAMATIALASTAGGQRPPPEDATGRSAKPAATAADYIVAAAHPLAVEAGLEILRDGGSAADAVVAVQLVLGLVEPQSSGLGGGAFLLFYDATARRVVALDGRETAPVAATPDLFLNADGTPMKFFDAVVGGRAVGTPGTVRLLEAIHRAHGRLAWARLFRRAIALAEQGFVVGPRLAAMLAGERRRRLATYARARNYFYPDGVPLAAGSVRRNPAYAASLRAIAAGGSDAFYRGRIAGDIAATVQGATGNPGRLTRDDLDAYAVRVRRPVCHGYRGWRVCGMGPPSSGALTVGQILGLLEHFDLPSLGPGDADSWHLLAEAAKLAYADRAVYMADADYVRVPVAGLLDRAYLTARAQRIDRAAAMAVPAPAGNPPWRAPARRAPDQGGGRAGTSHIAIVDGDGNAVSMTTTIEGAFGAQLMVDGFLLNNQLTDFSFRPAIDGRPVANRVEGGKRPAQLDGADNGIRRARPTAAGRRFARRQPHHRLCRAGVGRRARLGPRHPAGDRSGPRHQSQRRHRSGKRYAGRRLRRDACGARPRGADRTAQQWPARHRGAARRQPARRCRPAPRGRCPRRLGRHFSHGTGTGPLPLAVTHEPTIAWVAGSGPVPVDREMRQSVCAASE